MAPLPFRSTFHKYRKIFRAVFARLILWGHAGVSVWWVASRFESKFYGLLIACLVLFAAELGVILYFRAGCEWKRFCTSFAVYLLTLVPVLWYLRLNAENIASDGRTGNSTQSRDNSTGPAALTGTSTTTVNPGNVAAVVGDNKISDLLRDESVQSLLEQSMMFVIILCRWLLPRGRIDRSSLSQLLIMYSAISADILDFSEIFERNVAISSHSIFRYVVLGIWTWSLVQFTLVVTTSFQFRLRRRKQKSTNEQEDSGSQDKSEALSILMVFFMQDGPFLVARLCAVLIIKVQDYQIMFFSLKNALTLILALYRLLVLCKCINNEGNDLLTNEEVARSMESLDTVVCDTPKSKRKNRPKK